MSTDDPIHGDKPSFGELLRQSQPSANALFHSDRSVQHAPAPPTDTAPPPVAPVAPSEPAFEPPSAPVVLAREPRPRRQGWHQPAWLRKRGWLTWLIGFWIVSSIAGAISSALQPSSTSRGSSTAHASPTGRPRIQVDHSTVPNGVYLAAGRAIDGGAAGSAIEVGITGSGSQQRVYAVAGRDLRTRSCSRPGSFSLDHPSVVGSIIQGDAASGVFSDGDPALRHTMFVGGRVRGAKLSGDVVFFGAKSCVATLHFIATRTHTVTSPAAAKTTPGDKA